MKTTAVGCYRPSALPQATLMPLGGSSVLPHPPLLQRKLSTYPCAFGLSQVHWFHSLCHSLLSLHRHNRPPPSTSLWMTSCACCTGLPISLAVTQCLIGHSPDIPPWHMDVWGPCRACTFLLPLLTLLITGPPPSHRCYQVCMYVPIGSGH